MTDKANRSLPFISQILVAYSYLMLVVLIGLVLGWFSKQWLLPLVAIYVLLWMLEGRYRE